MTDLSVSKSLNREVINSNGLIMLSTTTSKGFKHAFYLFHPNGLETKHYTNESSHKFDIGFEEGVYRAVFYYRYMKKVKHHSFFFYIGSDKKIQVISQDLSVKNIVNQPGYKIDYYNIGSKKTFIVFNGSGSSKEDVPFGLRFLTENGFNVVACLQDNNQYQELSFKNMEEHVYPIVSEHDTYLYGSSLGGYCAVYYAGAVNGTVIAGAPRNSAHPLLIKKMGNSLSYDIDSFKHLDFKFNSKTKKNIYIFYDPYVNADSFFINSLIKDNFKELSLITCKHAGHEVFYHLNKTKQLKEIIKDITEGKEPVIKEMDSCYTYYGKANYAFSKNKYQKSLIFLEKALTDKQIKRSVKIKIENLHSLTTKKLEGSSSL